MRQDVRMFHVLPDGFPINLPPLGWARVCTAGDDYDAAARGVVLDVDSEEFALVIEICHERGLEIYGGPDGFHAEAL